MIIDFSHQTRIFIIWYLISSIFSFVSSWIASIFLLKSYYHRFPRFLFWIIMIIPLIYFISQYNPLPIYLLQQFLTSPAELIFDYTILYTFSDAMGGILIGVSFWLTGKRISNLKIKKYLYLSRLWIYFIIHLQSFDQHH